jgi:hypothetical protein
VQKSVGATGKRKISGWRLRQIMSAVLSVLFVGIEIAHHIAHTMSRGEENFGRCGYNDDDGDRRTMDWFLREKKNTSCLKIRSPLGPCEVAKQVTGNPFASSQPVVSPFQ